MSKIFLFIVFFSTIVLNVFSQDKIYKKGGEVLKVKVTEVGLDEIKYKLWDEPGGPVYAIDKEKVQKVVYEKGRTEVYQSNIKDPELYADQRKKALKFDFLKPLLGYSSFIYEQSRGIGKSVEISLDIIGLGKNFEIDYYYDPLGGYRIYRRNAKGIGFGAGYKFGKFPTFLSRGTRFSHLMQGIYVKPQGYLGYYNHNYVSYKTNGTTLEKENVFYSGMLIEAGSQWVIGDRFLIDWYGGLGYAFDNAGDGTDDDNYRYGAYNFSVARAGRTPSLGVSGGLRIGYLLK